MGLVLLDCGRLAEASNAIEKAIDFGAEASELLP